MRVRRASRTAAEDPYLVVENLTVQFPTHDGLVQAVTDLSYTVRSGQTLGIVGESGSGKSVSSMAVLGLHDRALDPARRLHPGRRHRGRSAPTPRRCGGCGATKSR